MPLSSHLAPGFIRGVYSGTFLPHHYIIPIKFAGVPTPGVSPEILPTSGDAVDWKEALDNFISTTFSLSFNEDTHFGLADIYAVDSVTGVRTFIFTGNVDMNGAETVSPNIPNVEGVFVFKTTAGRPLKVYTMEGIYAADARNVGVVPAGPRQSMINYITGPDNIFYGRTDAYPLAFSTFTSKVNDVLRQRQGFNDV